MFCAETCELVEFIIEPDEDLQTIIKDEVERFWKYVEDDVPPTGWKPCENLTEMRAVATKLPDEDVLVMECLGSEWRDAVSEYTEAKANSDEAKITLDSAKGVIIGLMEDSGLDAVDAEGARIYYRKPKARRTFQVKAFAASNPEIDLEPYYKEAASRKSLRVYERNH